LILVVGHNKQETNPIWFFEGENYSMSTTFQDLALPPALVAHLEEREINQPTAIQEQAIPVIAAGRDLIAESQTGTGKTLAYLLPAMMGIDEGARDVQVVVLVPTRELGMQIVREAEKIGAVLGRSVQQLIGGAALSRQVEKLRAHPQLVVGTPGRILELIKLRKLSLHGVKTLIVDEVDQVFDLGSKQEVERILGKTLRSRQILFFSATVSPAIREMADKWMNNPAEIRIKPEKKAAESLSHLYFVTEERDKIDMLRRVVRHFNPKAAIVFLNDTEDVAEITSKIAHTGLSIKALYGDSGKQARAAVMKGFREGRFQLLLATDVAARGLDFPGLTHVINFDLPIDADHYVHRAGRTGRMGRAGTVVSLLAEKERFIINKFTKALRVDFTEQTLFAGKLLAADERASRPARPDAPAPKAAGGSARSGASAGAPARGAAASSAAQAPGGGASARAAASGAPARASQPAAPRQSGGPRAGAGGAAPAAAGSAPRAGARSAGAAQPGRAGAAGKAAAAKPRSRKELERERKAKGAPKWLKAKQQQNGSPGDGQ
jgi:superfamily II DNA/RNA helicase